MRQYLSKIPDAIPSGQVLVHNNVRPRQRLGASGFRAWLSMPDPEKLVLCDCGWASRLGRHSRPKMSLREEED